LIGCRYYAFIKNPRINSKGLNTSAIFGFALTLDEVIRKQKPSHLAVVFDPPSPTFRHKEFAEYKANRPPMPEDLRASIPYIRQLIDAFNITQVEKEGYEADDVIGTMAKNAEKQGFDVYMMTPDKDYAQLVSDKIRMFKPRRSGQDVEILGKKEICQKFKIQDPTQVIDILALWGDSADNIPGAPGIGEKGAKDLVGHYGSISGIYDSIGDFKGKRQENLINFRDQIERARYLVTIVTDVDIDFNPESLKVTKPHRENLEKLFQELEFNNLARRIFDDQGDKAIKPPVVQNAQAIQGDLFGSTVEKTIDHDDPSGIDITQHHYHLLDSVQDQACKNPSYL